MSISKDIEAKTNDTPTLVGVQKTTQRHSAFNALGFVETIKVLHEEIKSLYLEDETPWIIGYSGGKDSTATLQLIWKAIAELEPQKRKKTVYVISTDTLVENPIVSAWVRNSMETLGQTAESQGLPFAPKLLHPKTSDSFWVNLIGRGYPAPRPKFRWCTERLKIRPSNNFITQVVSDTGQAILCIGARKAESVARAKVFEKHAKNRIRERLSPSGTLPGCLIYTTIEEWTNDDVWFYLNNTKNPWGTSNKELMGMYAGASPDGECPLVVDDSSPSCGDSRFGCWVCTLVEKDKSMTAMIQNDSEKDWMMPLLDLRNALDFRNSSTSEDEVSDHHLRDFRRLTGSVQIMAGGKPVPGPYTQEARENWLRRLLQAQAYVQKHAPSEIKKLELISLDQLQEIRRIWVIDKHELEDRLPRIYEEIVQMPYPGSSLDDNLVIGESEMTELLDLCSGNRLHYELTRELLSITLQQRSSGRRSKLNEKIEKALTRHFYDDKEDAVSRAQGMVEDRQRLENQLSWNQNPDFQEIRPLDREIDS